MKRVINGDRVQSISDEHHAVKITYVIEENKRNELVIYKKAVQSIFYDSQNEVIVIEGANILEIDFSAAQKNNFKNFKERIERTFSRH